MSGERRVARVVLNKSGKVQGTRIFLDDGSELVGAMRAEIVGDPAHGLWYFRFDFCRVEIESFDDTIPVVREGAG